MMTHLNLFALCGVVLFGVGLAGILACRHLVRKVIALNLMSTSIFLIMIALSSRTPAGPPDFVPHAMVLTGIVVSLSATALALALIRRLYRETGRTEFPDLPAWDSKPTGSGATGSGADIVEEDRGPEVPPGKGAG